MSALITQLEEISINAWSPLKSMMYDGWVIRMANGYTKRANAVHPLYPSVKPLAEKIAFCENLYSQYALPTIFKLTSASQPPELDPLLVERGYYSEPRVSVQTCDLGAFGSVALDGVQVES